MVTLTWSDTSGSTAERTRPPVAAARSWLWGWRAASGSPGAWDWPDRFFNEDFFGAGDFDLDRFGVFFLVDVFFLVELFFGEDFFGLFFGDGVLERDRFLGDGDFVEDSCSFSQPRRASAAFFVFFAPAPFFFFCSRSHSLICFFIPSSIMCTRVSHVLSESS